MSILYTADSHFLHKNILKYQPNRWIFLNKEEKDVMETGSDKDKRNLKISDQTIKAHDEHLISEWNKVVGPEDIVMHLGDFSFGDPYPIIRRLNGHIDHILGNHDKYLQEYMYREYNIEYLPTLREVTHYKQCIVLCHYAMRVWNKSHHRSWHLYGHSHGSLPDDPTSLSFDCGVDCNDLRPFTFEEVQERMNKKNVQILHNL